MKDRAAWSEWALKRKMRLSEEHAFDREMTAIGKEQNYPPGMAARPDVIAAQAKLNRLMNAEVDARTYQPQKAISGKLYPLVHLCIAHGLPEPIPEYLFAKDRGRMYRADYCWPAPQHRIIVEITGGTFLPGGGRHNRGAGMREDQKRANLAAVLGYRVLQYFPENLSDAIADLRELLA